jgi:hypothetical protein
MNLPIAANNYVRGHRQVKIITGNPDVYFLSTGPGDEKPASRMHPDRPRRHSDETELGGALPGNGHFPHRQSGRGALRGAALG